MKHALMLSLVLVLNALPLRADDLPAPWKQQDIGTAQVSTNAPAPGPAQVPGSATHADGTFTVQGTMDLWGTADGCHIVWQPAHGDVQIVARVAAMENPGNVPHAKAAVCIRESVEAGARHVTLSVTASDGTQLLYRDKAGEKTTHLVPDAPPPKNAVVPKGKFPCWLKIVRHGDEFTGYESVDGETWQVSGKVKLDLPADTIVGLTASSHKPDALTKATFDHVAVLNPSAPLRAPGDLPTTQPVGPLAAKLQPFVDHHTLAGAVVLVAAKDRVLDVEAVGYADIAAGKRMKTDDLFWIASQSKGMTAAALMMLVDEGKVNVDDPVEKYLPEFKSLTQVQEKVNGKTVLRPVSHPITVKNVLTHTSGLPFSSAKEKPTLDALPLAEAVKSYTEAPLVFQPDTKYQYANAGINTAGRIVEVVSGMPYEKFMQERLFRPLGMKDTTFWPTEEQVARLAKSYKPNKEKNGLEETTITQLRYPLTDHAHRYPMPAGGLFSTAADVAAFCQMLLNGGEAHGQRILSPGAVQQMTSTQDDDLQSNGKGENGYGFGISASRKIHPGAPVQPGSGGTFGHGGAYSTNMEVDPAHGLIFVYMVQHAGYPNTDSREIQPAFHKVAIEQFGKH